MTALAYAANAYWCAARRVRSGTANSDDANDLMLILRNFETPDSLFCGVVDAMSYAIDNSAPLSISDDDARELAWAINERNEMEEARWSEHPSHMFDSDPEVRPLRLGEVGRNG